MADGLFYNDLKAPFTAANIAAVTLSTTFLSLYPLSNFPLLPSGYFSFVGKKMKIRLFGQMTTAATPGNGQFGIYWNADTAAGTTQLATSAAFALVANATNLSWRVEVDIVCRAIGSSGALLATGMAVFPIGLVLSTVGMNQPIPASAPAQVTVDLTQNFIPSVQFLRSGSTAETMQVVDMDVIAMN
jgi:hypothetical protein